jgi:Nitroreductase family
MSATCKGVLGSSDLLSSSIFLRKTGYLAYHSWQRCQSYRGVQVSFLKNHSCRALRRFKPNPIPDEVLTKVLGAAIQAPCGGSEQNWLFVVVRSDDQRRKLGDI